MKTVLFIPGYQEDINSRDYQKTIRAIEAAGYTVEFVKIKWTRTTIGHWVDELNTVYEKYDPQDTILAGFSFGAMTAFLAATKRNPYALWLFSLSPYFYEDITNSRFRKSWLTSIGHRRADALKKLHFTKLIKTIACKTIYFYGKTELNSWPNITYRHEAIKFLHIASEVFIPKAKHDVTSSVYIEAIQKNISQS